MKYIAISALIVFNALCCAAEFSETNSAGAEEQNARILSQWEASLREANHGYLEEMQSCLSRSSKAITVLQELHENKSLADYYEQMKNRMAAIKVEPNGMVKSSAGYIPRIYAIIQREEAKLEALKNAGLDINSNHTNAIKILRIEETLVGDDMRMLQAEIALELSKAGASKDPNEVKGAFIKRTKERISQRLEIVNRVESELWVEVLLLVPQVEEEPLKPGEKRQENAELFETSRWVRRSELA